MPAPRIVLTAPRSYESPYIRARATHIHIYTYISSRRRATIEKRERERAGKYKHREPGESKKRLLRGGKEKRSKVGNYLKRNAGPLRSRRFAALECVSSARARARVCRSAE